MRQDLLVIVAVLYETAHQSVLEIWCKIWCSACRWNQWKGPR